MKYIALYEDSKRFAGIVECSRRPGVDEVKRALGYDLSFGGLAVTALRNMPVTVVRCDGEVFATEHAPQPFECRACGKRMGAGEVILYSAKCPDCGDTVEAYVIDVAELILGDGGPEAPPQDGERFSYACLECGSPDVIFRGGVKWDDEMQYWKISGKLGDGAGQCGSCSSTRCVRYPLGAGRGVVMEVGGGDGSARAITSDVAGEGYDTSQQVSPGGLTLARWLEIASPGMRCEASRAREGRGVPGLPGMLKYELILAGRAKDLSGWLGEIGEIGAGNSAT